MIIIKCSIISDVDAVAILVYERICHKIRLWKSKEKTALKIQTITRWL